MVYVVSNILLQTFSSIVRGLGDNTQYAFANFFSSAIIVEMLQLLLRLGTFQLSDIFYNTVGGMLGGLVYYVTMKARKHL